MTKKRPATPARLVVPTSDNYVVHVERLTFSMVREARASYDVFGPLATAQAAARLAFMLIPDDGREHFGVLTLDTKLNVLRYHEVGVGSHKHVAAAPPQVFGPVLRTLGADNVIVFHNHPTGDPTPSATDIAQTLDLERAATLLGLQFTDHIIIGSGTTRFESFRPRGKDSKRWEEHTLV